MGRKRVASRNFPYESLKHGLMPWPLFLRRAAAHFFLGIGAVIVAVGIGTVGYHSLGHLGWVDAFLNASMILGGMGPVDRLETNAAKIFAAFYALSSGIVFIALMGLVLAPWAHRMLHRMHLDEDQAGE